MPLIRLSFSISVFQLFSVSCFWSLPFATCPFFIHPHVIILLYHAHLTLGIRPACDLRITRGRKICQRRSSSIHGGPQISQPTPIGYRLSPTLSLTLSPTLSFNCLSRFTSHVSPITHHELRITFYVSAHVASPHPYLNENETRQ